MPARASRNRRLFRKPRKRVPHWEPQTPRSSQDAAAIMKDVAEDVEFTEMREFESESILEESDARRSRRIYREEQVSDAEYTEIHAKRAK